MKDPSEPHLPSTGWYCIRSKPRAEQIASFHLGEIEGVKAFLPRARRIRKSRSDKQSSQPLFPGYLFAYFDPVENLRAVNYCQGVSYVVKCQQKAVKVPDIIISELQAIGTEGILDIVDLPHSIGDEVRIVSGLFSGGEGKIVRLAPARERIKVLFEILGRETEVEISEEDIDFPSSNPMTATN